MDALDRLSTASCLSVSCTLGCGRPDVRFGFARLSGLLLHRPKALDTRLRLGLDTVVLTCPGSFFLLAPLEFLLRVGLVFLDTEPTRRRLTGDAAFLVCVRRITYERSD